MLTKSASRYDRSGAENAPGTFARALIPGISGLMS